MKQDPKNRYQRERTAKKTLSVDERKNHPVRVWRELYFLNQNQMGQLLGVSGSSVGFWERGVVKTPEWVMEIVSRDADEYTLRKINKIKPQKYPME